MSSLSRIPGDIEELWTQAVNAWKERRFPDAEPAFRKMLPFIEADHWKAPDFFTFFGQTLEGNGKLDEAYEMLCRSVEAALTSDEPRSVTVTVARLGLGEFLLRRQRYVDALAVIRPSIDDVSESRWILLYLAARIYYRQRSFPEFRSAAESAFLAAQGRFPSVEAIMARVAAEDSL